MSVVSPSSTQRSERAMLRWLAATALTCVTILCAQVYWNIPQTPIPITGQVFAVLLSGLLLGSRWGAVAQAQYLALGAANLHVFAQGHAGVAVLTGLTGGYLLSYPVAAFVVGWISERAFRSEGREQQTGMAREHHQMLACAAGLGVIYGLGCLWFGLASHTTAVLTLLQGALIFLGWDAVKAMAAIGVANALKLRK